MPRNKKKTTSKGRKKQRNNVARAVNDKVKKDDETWRKTLGGADNYDRQQSISRSTLYEEYKRATTSFKESIASLVPSLGTKVHDLIVAVDSLAEAKSKIVPPNLLQTLHSAIRIRQRVAMLYEEEMGEDPGHEYFIRVLQYCHQSLKPLVCQKTAKTSGKSQDSKRQGISDVTNKFEALSTADEDHDEFSKSLEEEEDNEASGDSWESKSMERPEETETDYELDDLINGSDFFLATAFLGTMNTLMGEVAAAYKNLKTICRKQKESEEKALLSFELMKCAVVANEAVQEMKYVEQVYAAERPYFESIYHLLAAGVFSKVISDIQRNMKGADHQEMRRAATEFVGDVLKRFCSGGNLSETLTKHSTMLEFAKKWKAPKEVIELAVSVVTVSCITEVGAMDERVECKLKDLYGDRIETAAKSQLSLPWLQHMRYFSSEASILQTVGAIEGYLCVIARFTDSALRDLCSSDLVLSWQELSKYSNFSTKHLRFHFVVPILIEIIGKLERLMFMQLPGEDCLFPILRLFREFFVMKYEDRGFSVSLVFVLHMLQIAVIELHGDDDLQRLSAVARFTVDGFFKDLHASFGAKAGYGFDITDFQEFNKCIMSSSTSNLAEIVYWNPCFAGMTILYMVYGRNVEYGIGTINMTSQLQSVIHLFHAFKEQGGELADYPLLSRLDEQFGASKTIWAVTPKPQKGDFEKHFWLGLGFRIGVVSQLMDENLIVKNGGGIDESSYAYRSNAKGSLQHFMKPEDVSTSYRNLMMAETSPCSSNCSLDQFRHRVSTMLDNIDKDRELLSCNMFSLGADLYKFVKEVVKCVLPGVKIDLEDTPAKMAALGALLSTLDDVESLQDDRVKFLPVLFSKFFSQEKTGRKYEYLV